MGLRAGSVVLAVAVLALVGDAWASGVPASQRQLDELKMRLQAQVKPAGAFASRSWNLWRRSRPVGATLSRADSTLEYRLGRSAVEALGIASGGVRCPKGAPNAISGVFAVPPESIGLVQLGDFFPAFTSPESARDWRLGVKSLAMTPSPWASGVVCSRSEVKYELFSSAADPLGSDFRVAECPRSAPFAISGFFLVASDTTGQLRLGDFFPALRGPTGKRRPGGWVIGVRNLTDRRQRWLGGAVCSRDVVRFTGALGTLDPLATAVNGGSCPRRTPKAVSGFFLLTTPAAVDASETGLFELGGFLPVLGEARRKARLWGSVALNVTLEPQEWIAGAMCMR